MDNVLSVVPDGNDRCVNGHVYPSKDAVHKLTADKAREITEENIKESTIDRFVESMDKAIKSAAEKNYNFFDPDSLFSSNEGISPRTEE